MAGRRATLSYDPETGHFYLCYNDGQLKKSGYIRPDGYVQVRYEGKQHLAHRVAWHITHGEWPKHTIDHINRDKSDNRISNLREATYTENNWNVGMFTTNTTGYKGVAKATHGGYRAVISIENKQHHIGSYETPELAYEAYYNKVNELRGEFANVG